MNSMKIVPKTKKKRSNKTNTLSLKNSFNDFYSFDDELLFYSNIINTNAFRLISTILVLS